MHSKIIHTTETPPGAAPGEPTSTPEPCSVSGKNCPNRARLLVIQQELHVIKARLEAETASYPPVAQAFGPELTRAEVCRVVEDWHNDATEGEHTGAYPGCPHPVCAAVGRA